jgi:hypothetical protein
MKTQSERDNRVKKNSSLSLRPLKFKEAVKGILEIKPQPQDKSTSLK